MSFNELFDTAHIHLETATLRVHVDDSSVFQMGIMNQDQTKPTFVLYVSRSNDWEQKKQSILVHVVDGFDLKELSDWIKKYDI